MPQNLKFVEAKSNLVQMLLGCYIHSQSMFGFVTRSESEEDESSTPALQVRKGSGKDADAVYQSKTQVRINTYSNKRMKTCDSSGDGGVQYQHQKGYSAISAGNFEWLPCLSWKQIQPRFSDQSIH